jgi:hypothetical protein
MVGTSYLGSWNGHWLTNRPWLDGLDGLRILSDYIGRKKVLFMALLGGAAGGTSAGALLGPPKHNMVF